MKQTREIELKIEKSETIIVRRRRQIILARCTDCGREVEMFSPEEAAVIAETSPRRIYHAIESNQIHFTELPEGLLLVCLDSLKATRQSEPPAVAGG